MRRDLAGLLLGLICVGGAGSWMAVREGFVGIRHAGLLIAVVMVVAGLIGLAVSAARGRNRDPNRDRFTNRSRTD